MSAIGVLTPIIDADVVGICHRFILSEIVVPLFDNMFNNQSP
jgi:hypothetical protein